MTTLKELRELAEKDGHPQVTWPDRQLLQVSVGFGPERAAFIAACDPATILKMLDVVEVAKCIHHWHDAMADNSGMVVSAEHVRKLWESLSILERNQ